MKALVVAGGLPQAELLDNLKRRGITTVLVDMNEKCMARPHADIFYATSTLDVEGVKQVAIKEKVDFLITVCADQVLLVVAEISEALNLPCYIDYETGKNVSDKGFMKRIFKENGVPTTNYVVATELANVDLSGLRYPLVVKPVDAYSSRGVKRVENYEELSVAFESAKEISRSKNVIVEEFFEGQELTVDVYVENGKAHVLCVSALYKVPGNNKFVIHRGVYPAPYDQSVLAKIEDTANKIAKGFGLFNTPMLIQLITDGKDISVVEFCARTGGGIKFRAIKSATGFDVVDAVVELTLGNKPKVEIKKSGEMVVNEFLYCSEGEFDHLEGFDELVKEGVIKEYFLLKAKGVKLGQINSSGDRIACFTVSDVDKEQLLKKHALVNQRIKVVSTEGKDILRHDIVGNLQL